MNMSGSQIGSPTLRAQSSIPEEELKFISTEYNKNETKQICTKLSLQKYFDRENYDEGLKLREEVFELVEELHVIIEKLQDYDSDVEFQEYVLLGNRTLDLLKKNADMTSTLSKFLDIDIKLLKEFVHSLHQLRFDWKSFFRKKGDF